MFLRRRVREENTDVRPASSRQIAKWRGRFNISRLSRRPEILTRIIPGTAGVGGPLNASNSLKEVKGSNWMRADLFIHSESRWLRCPQRVGLTFSVPRNIRNQPKSQGRNAKAALTPTLAPALLSLHGRGIGVHRDARGPRGPAAPAEGGALAGAVHDRRGTGRGEEPTFAAHRKRHPTPGTVHSGWIQACLQERDAASGRRDGGARDRRTDNASHAIPRRLRHSATLHLGAYTSMAR